MREQYPAIDPYRSLRLAVDDNTTPHLVADMEAIRRHLGGGPARE